MHLLAEESIRINRAASEVFEYVTNMEHFGDWFPGVLAIESANRHAHGQVGKEYREKVSVPLRGERKVRIVVCEARTNSFFATEGHFPPVMPRMELAFSQEAGNACTVTWKMFSRNKGLLFRLSMLPLARNIMRKRAAAGMKRLKTRLETSRHAETAM
ncbi:MAG TPA: SRPBCC family protein [Noviherbaspirillum sp.]